MVPRHPRYFGLFIAKLGIALACAAASEVTPLTVAEDDDRFPPRIERMIGGRTVKLVRTGRAVRKQLGFKVYDVASYLADGVKAKTAEELAAAAQPKQLHLVFTMTVSGDDMANSFESILRRNYPAPAFAKESEQLLRQLRKTTVRKGDEILMTHIPDKGLLYRYQSKNAKDELFISTPAFSKAVWDNYLGENNCGEVVKLGLISELARQPQTTPK